MIVDRVCGIRPRSIRSLTAEQYDFEIEKVSRLRSSLTRTVPFTAPSLGGGSGLRAAVDPAPSAYGSRGPNTSPRIGVEGEWPWRRGALLGHSRRAGRVAPPVGWVPIIGRVAPRAVP